MIPSRGLRWSGQAIGIGRRRLDLFSARQFSSSVHHGPIRAGPLLSKNVTSLPSRPLSSRPALILRNGIGARFASTAPVPASPPPAAPVAASTEAASSQSTATPITEYTSSSSLDSVTDLDPESLYNIPESIGYLKALGLDYGYGPTALMEWTLEHVHIFAGTPWWVSISLTAILARAVLFKPYINAAENAARLGAVQPLTAPITARMTAASKLGDQQQAMQLRAELQRIHKRAGIRVWKSFVPMLQVIAGYGTFVILRAMSRIPVPGLETGGTLWFHNLSIPDPYWVLPIATAGVLHWVLRKGGETGVSNMSPQVFNAMKWGLPLVSFLFTFWLPAALQLSFFVSGLLSFGQATLMRQSWFRSYFKMSPLPKPRTSTPTSPRYKGSQKVAAEPVLSSAELNSRFQGASPSSQSQTTGERKSASPLKGTVSKFLGSVTAPIDEFVDAGKGLVNKGRKSLKNRGEKADLTAQKKYEEKRLAELKRERMDLANRRRAERAARKRQNL